MKDDANTLILFGIVLILLMYAFVLTDFKNRIDQFEKKDIEIRYIYVHDVIGTIVK